MNIDFYRPQRSWGNVCVILFTGRGGGCLSACWDTHPPPRQGRPPPGRAYPPGKADPPLCAVHAWKYGQQAGGMHPTGMQFLFYL